MARPHPLSTPDACVQFYIEPWEKEVRRKLEAATAELFMSHQRAERSSVKGRVQTLRAVLRHLQGKTPQDDSIVDRQREQIALLRVKLRDTKRKLSVLAERHRAQRKIIRELRAQSLPRSDGRRTQPRHRAAAASALRSFRKHLPAPEDHPRHGWARSADSSFSGEESEGTGQYPELPMEQAEQAPLREEDEETLCIKMSELRKITESTARRLWAEPEETLGSREKILRTEADGRWGREEGKEAESKSQGGRRHDVMDCFRKMFTFFTRGSAPCRLEE